MDIAPAARLNAHWCDTVVSSHRIATATSSTRWTARHRTPVGYPDAITLAPRIDPSNILAGTERGPGLSVKDSFSDLDLHRHGLTVLFTASWIHAEPQDRPTVLPWRQINDPREFGQWAKISNRPAITQRLLANSAVQLWTVRRLDRISAAAWFNRTTDGIGLSNVLISNENPVTVWSDLPRLAPQIGPGPIWGYETHSGLPIAVNVGFETTGPLRVWMHRDPATQPATH